MAYPQEFGLWLQAELDRRDWTTVFLSKKIGVSQPHISRIIDGTRKPGPSTLAALAKGLDLPPETIFQKAGLLPPTKENLDNLEKEWEYLFDQAGNDEERRELLERARFELTRIRERRSHYDTD